jgi:hypothetical protein
MVLSPQANPFLGSRRDPQLITLSRKVMLVNLVEMAKNGKGTKISSCKSFTREMVRV